jgi:hypothetical protein
MFGVRYPIMPFLNVLRLEYPMWNGIMPGK